MLLQRLLKKKEGFTLVELLIVIAIIAILAAIAIPQFTQYRNRAYRSELESDAKNGYTAAQAYLTDNPGGTIVDEVQLEDGGLRLSKNITVTSGGMTLNAGQFVLTSSAAEDADDVATVYFNGKIEIN